MDALLVAKFSQHAAAAVESVNGGRMEEQAGWRASSGLITVRDAKNF